MFTQNMVMDNGYRRDGLLLAGPYVCRLMGSGTVAVKLDLGRPTACNFCICGESYVVQSPCERLKNREGRCAVNMIWASFASVDNKY